MADIGQESRFQTLALAFHLLLNVQLAQLLRLALGRAPPRALGAIGGRSGRPPRELGRSRPRASLRLARAARREGAGHALDAVDEIGAEPLWRARDLEVG